MDTKLEDDLIEGVSLKDIIPNYTGDDRRKLLVEWIKTTSHNLIHSDRYSYIREVITNYTKKGVIKCSISNYSLDHLKSYYKFPQCCGSIPTTYYYNITDGFFKGCHFEFSQNRTRQKVDKKTETKIHLRIKFIIGVKKGICETCLVKKATRGCKCYKKTLLFF